MVNNGLSPYGSAQLSPFFQPFGMSDFFIPPVHSGIEPSLLPARSEPIGVSSLPSFAASSGETFANTLETLAAAITTPSAHIVLMNFIETTSLYRAKLGIRKSMKH